MPLTVITRGRATLQCDQVEIVRSGDEDEARCRLQISSGMMGIVHTIGESQGSEPPLWMILDYNGISSAIENGESFVNLKQSPFLCALIVPSPIKRLGQNHHGKN